MSRPLAAVLFAGLILLTGALAMRQITRVHHARQRQQAICATELRAHLSRARTQAVVLPEDRCLALVVLGVR